MKNNSEINGYKITQDFMYNSGTSCWCFAEKDGRSFFLKEFLLPRYPTVDSPGSDSLLDKKLKDCLEFEKHINLLNSAINNRNRSKHIISTIDFFRYKTKYYKITRKVEVVAVDVKANFKTSLDELLPVLIDATEGLASLHRVNIVHGDLKPSNILFEKTDRGHLSAKIIDFDNAYFSSTPPLAINIIGDPVYYSPELALYVLEKKSVKPEMIQTKSDIFALGLLFYWFLVGELPKFNEKHGYPSIALINGDNLELVTDALPNNLHGLIKSMLKIDPDQRPSTNQILKKLMSCLS